MSRRVGLRFLPSIDFLGSDGVAHVAGKAFPCGLLRHTQGITDLGPAVTRTARVLNGLPHRLLERRRRSATLCKRIKRPGIPVAQSPKPEPTPCADHANLR